MTYQHRSFIIFFSSNKEANKTVIGEKTNTPIIVFVDGNSENPVNAEIENNNSNRQQIRIAEK